MYVIFLIYFMFLLCLCIVLCIGIMVIFFVGIILCFWFVDEIFIDEDWIGWVFEGIEILVRFWRKGVIVVWILIDLNKDEDVVMIVEGLNMDCLFFLIFVFFWYFLMMLLLVFVK